MRTASRELCDMVNALLFCHIVIHFTAAAVVIYHPSRLALPLVPHTLEGELSNWPVSVPSCAAGIARWPLHASWTSTATLGPSTAGGTSRLDYFRAWNGQVRVNFSSITIPLVRDMREWGCYCPLDAEEWHRYTSPYDSMEMSNIYPARLSKCFVLHFPSFPPLMPPYSMGYYWHWGGLAFGFSTHPRPVVGNTIFLRHETGRPLHRYDDDRNRRDRLTNFIASLGCVLCASDVNLKFVGWENLTADVLQDAGFNMEEVVPHKGMPLAVAAMLHKRDVQFSSRAEIDNWCDRITSCSVEEWRQASAYLDLALEWPQRPPRLRAADQQGLHAFEGWFSPQRSLTPAEPVSKLKRFAREISISGRAREKKQCIVM